jgi:hypothetical protein
MVITVSASRRALVMGADLICSNPSDISKYLCCLVPFQPSFQVRLGERPLEAEGGLGRAPGLRMLHHILA